LLKLEMMKHHRAILTERILKLEASLS
jgi:hypothetical protein